MAAGMDWRREEKGARVIASNENCEVKAEQEGLRTALERLNNTLDEILVACGQPAEAHGPMVSDGTIEERLVFYAKVLDVMDRQARAIFSHVKAAVDIMSS